MKTYKFGKPDKYGDFPYLYSRDYTDEQLPEILEERLPDHYPMQIVEQKQADVLAALVNMGIDAHLEAVTGTAQVEDRKLTDGRVYQRHLGANFDKKGMICLIRRFQEFDANKHFDFSKFEIPEGEHESVEERAIWEAANTLGSDILETLGIEVYLNY